MNVPTFDSAEILMYNAAPGAHDLVYDSTRAASQTPIMAAR